MKLKLFAFLSFCFFYQNILAISIKDASKELGKNFSTEWPPKEVVKPYSSAQIESLVLMTNAVEKTLIENKILFKKLNDKKIQILSDNNGVLGKYANELDKNGIRLVYDAEYFAISFYSAGHFSELEKEVKLSHVNFDNLDNAVSVIKHEMVHVNTYLNKLNKKPSFYYCQFNGEQFKPHSLNCDEIVAYTESSSEQMKKMFKMYHGSVLNLLEHLDYKRFYEKSGIIYIPGKNAQGDFVMELPSFSSSFNIREEKSLRQFIAQFKDELNSSKI